MVPSCRLGGLRLSLKERLHARALSPFLRGGLSRWSVDDCIHSIAKLDTTDRPRSADATDRDRPQSQSPPSKREVAMLKAWKHDFLLIMNYAQVATTRDGFDRLVGRLAWLRQTEIQAQACRGENRWKGGNISEMYECGWVGVAFARLGKKYHEIHHSFALRVRKGYRLKIQILLNCTCIFWYFFKVFAPTLSVWCQNLRE